MYAKQRAKDLAEHGKIIVNKDKEIEHLRESVRGLTDKTLINESQMMMLTANDSNGEFFGESLHLRRVIAQASKERLLLESQLALFTKRGVCKEPARKERRSPDEGENSLPSWAKTRKPTDDRRELGRTETSSEELEHLHKEIDALSKVAEENGQLKQELLLSHKKCLELEARIRDMERDELNLESKRKDEEIEELAKELREMRNKLHAVEQDLCAANVLTGKLEESSRLLKTRCEELEKTESECLNLKKKLRDGEDKLNRSDEKVASLESRLSQLQSVMINLQAVSSQYEALKLSHTNAVQQLKEKDVTLQQTKNIMKDLTTKNESVIAALEERLKRMEEKLNRQSSQHNAVLGELRLKQEEAEKWKFLYSDSLQNITQMHSKEKRHEDRQKLLLQVAQSATASAEAANFAISSMTSRVSVSDSEYTPQSNQPETLSEPASPQRTSKKLNNVGQPTATSSPLKMKKRKPVHGGEDGVTARPNPSSHHFALFRAIRDDQPLNPDDPPIFANGDYLFASGRRNDGFYEVETLSGQKGLAPEDAIVKVDNDAFLDVSTVRKMISHLSKVYDNDVSLCIGNTTLGCDLDGSDDFAADSPKKIVCFADLTLTNSASGEELVQPPSNLVVESHFETAYIVSWKPPIPERPVLRYLVFLNGAISVEIAANNLSTYRTILDGLDADVQNRISVKSVTDAGSSATSACTMMIGKDADWSPTEMVRSFVTSNSATVTWLPGNSNLSHAILVDQASAGVLSPGVYSTIISGLKPAKTYLVTVEPLREGVAIGSSSIDVETKNFGSLEPPPHVVVTPGSEPTALKVSWMPLALNAEGKYDCHEIQGYGVFVDGVEVGAGGVRCDALEIDLRSFSLPATLTARTLSKKSWSPDSDPVHLTAESLAELFSKAALEESPDSEATTADRSTEDSGIKSLVEPEKSMRRFVARWGYDPSVSSPNVDYKHELEFKKGDILTVFGDVDEDGFFYGELNNRKGLVPSNFLMEMDGRVVVSPLATIEEINEESRERRRDSFGSSCSDVGEFSSEKRSSLSSRPCPSDDTLSPTASPPRCQPSNSVPQLSSTKMSSAPSSPSKPVKRFPYPSHRRKVDDSVVDSLADVSHIPESRQLTQGTDRTDADRKTLPPSSGRLVNGVAFMTSPSPESLTVSSNDTPNALNAPFASTSVANAISSHSPHEFSHPFRHSK